MRVWAVACRAQIGYRSASGIWTQLDKQQDYKRTEHNHTNQTTKGPGQPNSGPNPTPSKLMGYTVRTMMQHTDTTTAYRKLLLYGLCECTTTVYKLPRLFLSSRRLPVPTKIYHARLDKFKLPLPCLLLHFLICCFVLIVAFRNRQADTWAS